MYLSLVVILTGSWFFSLLKQFLHITTIPGHWSWMRYCLLFALMFLFLALFFRTTVPRAKPRPPVLVGAALTAVLMVAASGLFSWFLGQSSRYSLVYGSLASIIILMVWLYLCGTILILGTVFNYVWYCYQHHSEVL
jgi:membrane protein